MNVFGKPIALMEQPHSEGGRMRHESFLRTIVLAAVGCFAHAAQAGMLVVDGPAYTQAQRLVEVDPGRRLNLYCIGHGEPAVVFDAGLTDPINVWGLVQPEIAADTTACSYDRAGIGFSDESPRPSTSANAVEDLHKLLKSAGIKPPFVFVGASSAGLNMRLYAYTYPEDLAGLVLVDPSHEDQREEFRKLDPRKLSAVEWDAQVVNPSLDKRRECIAAAVAGLVPGTEEYGKCGFPQYPQLSEEVQAATVEFQMTPKFQRAQLSEEENVLRASASELRAAHRSLGALPLIVLISDRSPPPKDTLTTEQISLREARYQLWVRLAQQSAAISSLGRERVVPGAGHAIHLENPDSVVQAIREIVAPLQGGRVTE